MRYIVESAFIQKDFEESINKKIEQGYIPIGGLAVLSGKYKDSAGRFYQSMLLNTPMFLKCPECGYQMEQLKNNELFSCCNEDCCNEIEVLKNSNE